MSSLRIAGQPDITSAPDAARFSASDSIRISGTAGYNCLTDGGSPAAATSFGNQENAVAAVWCGHVSGRYASSKNPSVPSTGISFAESLSIGLSYSTVIQSSNAPMKHIRSAVNNRRNGSLKRNRMIGAN